MESATIFTIFVDRQGKELTRVESFLPLRENMKIRLKEKKGGEAEYYVTDWYFDESRGLIATVVQRTYSTSLLGQPQD
jgi:uncharacterized protein YrrD